MDDKDDLILDELKRVQECRELPWRGTSAPRMCQDMPDESCQPGLECRHRIYGDTKDCLEEERLCPGCCLSGTLLLRVR